MNNRMKKKLLFNEKKVYANLRTLKKSRIFT